MYSRCLWSVELYRLKNWALTGNLEKRIQVTESKWYRRMLCHIIQERRTNECVWHAQVFIVDRQGSHVIMVRARFVLELFMWQMFVPPTCQLRPSDDNSNELSLKLSLILLYQKTPPSANWNFCASFQFYRMKKQEAHHQVGLGKTRAA